MQYLIDTRKEFRGNAQSVIVDGLVAYSGCLTLKQYKAEHGDHFKVVEEDEYLKLVSDFEASLVTEPSEITQEDWDYMLGELPPLRWHHHRGIELFACPEMLTGTLTRWCARLDGKFYTFTDHLWTPSEILAAKVATL